MKKKWLAFTILFLVLVFIILTTSFLLLKREKQAVFKAGISFSYLPQDAVFIPHLEDEKLVKEKGGIAMLHYATPEAIIAGGPIFGVVGHSVVSVEYEISSESVGELPVGDPTEFGRSLLLRNFPWDKKDGLYYDHFHIGKAHTHVHIADGTQRSLLEHTHDDIIYLIHFMFIPHEMEVAYGLTCS